MNEEYQVWTEDRKTRFVIDVMDSGSRAQLTIYRDGLDPVVIPLRMGELEDLTYAISAANADMQYLNS